jgi:hypothetical protein
VYRLGLRAGLQHTRHSFPRHFGGNPGAIFGFEGLLKHVKGIGFLQRARVVGKKGFPKLNESHDQVQSGTNGTNEAAPALLLRSVSREERRYLKIL